MKCMVKCKIGMIYCLLVHQEMDDGADGPEQACLGGVLLGTGSQGLWETEEVKRPGEGPLVQREEATTPEPSHYYFGLWNVSPENSFLEKD